MAFSYKRAITIPSGTVGSDLTDFPVYFHSNDSTFGQTINGGHVTNANGYDIVPYADSALTTPLKFQRSSYISSMGFTSVSLWIKVPTVSASSDTTIYLAYGDSNITTDQSTPTEVWDSNYEGVYHLDDSSGPFLDSTFHARSGIGAGVLNASGKVDSAASFSNAGSPQYLEIDGTMGSPASVSIELWAKSNLASDVDYTPTLVDIGGEIYIDLQHNASDAYTNDIVFATSGGTHVLGTTGDYTHDNTWHHYVYTADGSTLTLYVDGASAATDTGFTFDYTFGTGKTRIGAEAFNTTPTSAFNGQIDEVRVSSVVRSADYVLASFNNQSSPSTFLTIGSEASATDPRTLPTIDWTAPAAITYGTALSSTQLSAVEHNSIPGTFAYDIGGTSVSVGTVLDAGTYSLHVLFTPTDTVTYQPASKTVSLTVQQASTSISWGPLSAITNPSALTSTELSAVEDSSIPGSFEYRDTDNSTVISVGTVLAAGTHTLHVAFTPTSANYSGSTATATLVVNPNPAAPTVPTFVQGVAGTGTTASPDSATFPVDVTAGNTIIVLLAHNYLGCSPGGTITDSLGNVLTRVGTGKNPGSNQFLWGYIGKVVTGGPCTVTVTYGCGIARWTYFTEWAGLGDNPYDGDAVNSFSTNSGVAGEVTTTQAGDLVLSAWSGSAAPSWTAGSGEIILNVSNDALQWEIATSAGAVAPTATGTGIGTTYNGYGSTMAFKAAPAPSHDYTQDLADTFSVAEAFLRSTGKVWFDSTPIAELLHRATSTSRIDSIAITSVLARGTSRPLLESMAPADSILKAPTKLATDAVTLAEAATKATSIGKSDSFSLGDVFTSMRGKLVMLLDSISFQDSISRASNRTIVEALVLSESITKATSRTYRETISLADSIAKRAQRTYADAITLADSLRRSITRKLAETLDLSDAFEALFTLILELADSISLSDAISRSTGKVYRETLSITDSLKRGISRAFAEVLSLLDIITKLKSRGIAFADSLAIEDSISRATTKALRESITLAETIRRATTRTFTDAIDLVDTFAATFHRFVAAVRTFLAEALQRLWSSDYQIRTWEADEQPQRIFTGDEIMISGIEKPAESIEDFRIDWSEAIGEDTIVASTWSTPDGITAVQDSHTDTTATVRLSGGTIGHRYLVENLVDLLSGQRKVQVLQLVATQ